MTLDEQLVDRIRALLAGEHNLTERRMFGGVAFMVDGNMAVVASGRGGCMVRAGDRASALLASSPAEQMLMRGRPMTGWVTIAGAHLESDDALGDWVDVGLEFARTLPPKSP